MPPVSPAKAHLHRHVAATLAAANAAGVPDMRHANAYELMLAQLAEHRRRLKLVQSIERKADVKRDMLPEYAPWIDGTLAGDTGVQDDVVMTVMVWRIDVGDYAGALPIAAYAIRHRLAMPDQYERTTACLIAEEFADAALRARAAAQPFDPSLLEAVEVIIHDEDMPDEVRAKLHKAIGLLRSDLAELASDTDPQAYHTARAYLLRAMELHDKVGVKKDVERLERKLKGLEHPQESPAPAAPVDAVALQNSAASFPTD
jgi:terminase small subunit